MVAILMMSAKLATLGLLKIKLFQNKGYDVINPVHDMTNTMNQIVSRESNYVADGHILNFIRNLPKKPNFLRSALSSSSVI